MLEIKRQDKYENEMCTDCFLDIPGAFPFRGNGTFIFGLEGCVKRWNESPEICKWKSRF